MVVQPVLITAAMWTGTQPEHVRWLELLLQHYQLTHINRCSASQIYDPVASCPHTLQGRSRKAGEQSPPNDS